jgi:glycosyltransferase involved in cell wall biosynthesis
VEKKADYFVFLARTTWRVKNVKTAIAWANDLGVRLVIMGGSGISRGNIEYRGLVDEPEKVDLLSNARALIYPTNWDEPCAGAPLEALACGTPVISSANGCMPELVRPGTGVVCRSYAELLAAPRVLENVKTVDCRRAVEEFFSVRRMAEDYLSLMQRIVKQGELDHEPNYNFNPDSVELLYKPTITNRLRAALFGKV